MAYAKGIDHPGGDDTMAKDTVPAIVPSIAPEVDVVVSEEENEPEPGTNLMSWF